MIINDYTLTPYFPLVTSRKYSLTVRDLPQEERPREKLITSGGDTLSLVELLSVVLGSGTKKEGVLDMSQRIVKEYGEKNLLIERNPERLAEQLDIPITRALQIVAAVEIGRRLFDRSPANGAIIRSAQDVSKYADGMRLLTKEYLRGIYLNSHYRVIHDEVISIGTVDGSVVHPREVFRPAIERSAAGLVVVHNHPSGDPSPSLEDIEVTKQLKSAGQVLGIELIDHVIIAGDTFSSVFDVINNDL